MDGRDQDVRGALATLLEAEPPMRMTVADDVRRGRALHARRQRRLAGGVTAVVIVGLGVGFGAPRLLDRVTPPDRAPVAGNSDELDAMVSRSERELRDMGMAVTLVPPKVLDDRARWAFTFPPQADWAQDVPPTLSVVVYPDRTDALVRGCAPDQLCGKDVWVPDPARSTDYGQAIRQQGPSALELLRTYNGGGMIQLVARTTNPEQLSIAYSPPLTGQQLEAVADAIGDPDVLATDVLEPVPDVAAPAVVEGEVARAVLSDAIESHTGTPDAATTYVVRAACAARGTGHSDLRYAVRDESAGSEVLSSGSVPCDGAVVQNSASPLPAHRLSLTLVGPANAQGWAVLVPYPSLAEQQKGQRRAQAERDRDKAQRSAEEAAPQYP